MTVMDQVLDVMNEPIDPSCPKCGVTIPSGAPHGLCPKCVLADVSAATQEDTRMSKGLEVPDPKRLAEAFPDFEIKELIGQGGMGFVYRARQSKLDRDVALKVLPESLAKDPTFSERFSREGRLLAKLNHNNIVTVFDFGQSGPFFFLLMEFVDGVNLRQAMRAGKFTPEQALSVVPKICEALQYAHDKNVLHRDIKPENILMDAQGQVKIADFGIAKMVGDSKTNSGLTVSGANLGTPHYMAPEQVESSSSVDHRADIYSLGVVFYELLTGELPLGRFDAPSNRTTLDARLDEIVLRALEKDRERRQQSADEIKTQVEHLSETENATCSSSPSPRLSSNAAQSRALAPAIGLGLVALVNFLRILPGSGTDGFQNFSLSFIESLMTPMGVILATISGFLVFAALKLSRLEHRGIALLGGVIALISFPWTLVGFPIGIWVLNVLHSTEMKESFSDYKPRLKTHQTGNPWPHRVFWLIISIVVIPILLIVIGLIVPWLAYQGAKAPSEPAEHVIEAKQSHEGDMEAEVAGGKLSLIAISHSEGDNPQWIKPNKMPFEVTEIDSTDINVTPESGERSYSFLFDTKSLPDTAKVTQWVSEPPFSTLAQGTPKRDGQHDPSLILLKGIWANNVTEVSLVSFVATGEFTTLANCDAMSISNNNYSHQAGTYKEGNWEFTFSSPHHDSESTVVVLAYDYEGGAIRLVAQDKNGEIHTSTKGQTGTQHLTAVFEGLEIEDITQFSAQISPFTTINFPDVALPLQKESK